MYVCVCNAVTDREIVEQVRRGSDTIEAIRFELGVATCCGQCTDCAIAVIEAARLERDAPAGATATDIRRPRTVLSSPA